MKIVNIRFGYMCSNLSTHQVVKIRQVDAAAGALAKVVPVTVVIIFVVLGIVFIVILLLRFVIVVVVIVSLSVIKLDKRAVGGARALVAKSRLLLFSVNRPRPKNNGRVFKSILISMSNDPVNFRSSMLG